MNFTYHDLKVNTDQIAYPNRVGGGQFLTLKFDPIFMVYITYRYFKRKEERDLTQSYDKSSYTNRNVKKAK